MAAAVPLAAWAADHADSPAAAADPLADIADLYAWMTPEADKVNLALTVAGLSGADAFGTSVQYVFHINSTTAFPSPGGATLTTIVCQFYDATNIECWAGEGEGVAYVTGDPSVEAGISNDDESIKVFAGLRDDPFFMELQGFNEVVSTVIAAAPDLPMSDVEGCPQVPAETSAALVAQLSSGPDGADATDTLEGTTVLGLVVQVDKELVTGGGDILQVWASTRSL